LDNQRVRLTLLAAFLFTLTFFFVMGPDRRPTPPVGSGAQTPAATDPNGADPAPPTAPSTTPSKFEMTSAEDIAIAPLENDMLRVELTAVGGGITQVWLKQHFRTAELRDAGKVGTEGWEPLFPEKTFATTLAMAEHGASRAEAEALANKPWTVREEVNTNGARVVVFAFRTGAGIELEKRLSLKPGSYAVDVEITSKKLDDSLPQSRIFRVRVGGGVAETKRGQMSNEPEAVAMQLAAYDEATVMRHHASDLAGSPQTFEKPANGILAWGGVANHYFTALLAPSDSFADERTVAITLGAADANNSQSVTAEVAVSLPLDLDRAGATNFRFYCGPKDPDLLAKQSLPRLIPFVEEDYGSTFRWVNKALLAGLRFFHGLVGNWGVAIMLLTLLVRALVFPITRAQQVSMAKYAAKMAILKPKLDRLKAEMSDKPQQFAQEQMKLLREHGATPPLFGCLSSFITLPVFVGMFQILRTAIELRQAPFVGWISDLSLADRLYTIPGIDIDINVLPILATGAFVLQIAIQPKPADPQAAQQQKIMMIMPIVFGVLFYAYAAGLSLYSLTSSALAIFETKVIRKKWPVPMPGQAAPPAVVDVQVVKK
jgi:YidC/Oxa1 family membrane protein insertase